MPKYIYEYKIWTDFTWENAVIHSIFGEVRWMQGKIIGQMNALGFSAKEEATLNTLTLDVVKSSEIEGELLNYEQVRSSVARRLGINSAGLVKSSRHFNIYSQKSNRLPKIPNHPGKRHYFKILIESGFW